MDPKILDMQIYAYVFEHPGCILGDVVEHMHKINPDEKLRTLNNEVAWRDLILRHLRSMARYGILKEIEERPRRYYANNGRPSKSIEED